MNQSTKNDMMDEKAVKSGYGDHPAGDDTTIEPGTPFPEPEVKPAIVSPTPAGSQAGTAQQSGQTAAGSKGTGAA